MDSRLSEEWPFYSHRLIDMPVSDVGPFKLLLLTFQRNIVNNSQGWECSPQMSVRPTLSLTLTSDDHCPAFISNVTDSFCTHWGRLGMKLDIGELIVSYFICSIVHCSYSILVNRKWNNNRTWTQASPHMSWHVDSNCGILVNTSLDHYHRNRSLLWFVLPWKHPSGLTTLNVIDLFSIKNPIFELSLHPTVLCLYPKPQGRMSLPNRMNFRKKSKRPSTPSPHFRKMILQFFTMDMVE